MKRIAIGILGMAAMSVTHADPLYISDKLVVNVYAEADQEGSKITTLDSGDAVESIEKVDTYTHVRLADNREGWIKSSYLTAQVPAVLRLKELEKERGATTAAATTQLSDELKKIKEQNAILQTELAAAKLTARSPAPEASPTPPPQKPTEVEQVARDRQSPGLVANRAPNQVPSQASNETTQLSWIVAVGLLGGTLGFALGYQQLARRIRRKYGSVRIY